MRVSVIFIRVEFEEGPEPLFVFLLLLNRRWNAPPAAPLKNRVFKNIKRELEFHRSSLPRSSRVHARRNTQYLSLTRVFVTRGFQPTEQGRMTSTCTFTFHLSHDSEHELELPKCRERGGGAGAGGGLYGGDHTGSMYTTRHRRKGYDQTTAGKKRERKKEPQLLTGWTRSVFTYPSYCYNRTTDSLHRHLALAALLALLLHLKTHVARAPGQTSTTESTAFQRLQLAHSMAVMIGSPMLTSFGHDPIDMYPLPKLIDLPLVPF